MLFLSRRGSSIVNRNLVLDKIRTPELFFALTVCAAFVSVFSLKVGFYAGIALIFIFFRLKPACIILLFYIAGTFMSAHSAFILDIQYNGGKRSLITTKGRLNNVQVNEPSIGDLMRGAFKYDVQRTKHGIPRLVAEPVGDYTLHKVFIISTILKERQSKSASLFNRSGGKIRTTQAHIYAVRSYITDRERDEFVVTGLAHLLAMSGFHVGIFTAGVFLLFSFMPRRTRVIPAVILLPLLIPLSGFAITVTRAVFFALATLIGWFADLKVVSLKSLALLAGFILLFSPFSLFSISFLLSFSAVFGIIVLLRERRTFLKGIIAVGIASSIFITPLQLYFFGTANIVSVLTTVVMTPVVWAQMVTGLFAAVFPSVMIAPLSVIEQFAAWLMTFLYKVTWSFMYVSKQPSVLLAAVFIAALAVSFTKYRLISVAVLFLPLLPWYPKHELYFPKLPPSAKGYVLVDGNRSEIFYQGMRSAFVYDMLPAAARFGIKKFDYGSVRIFDGENLYLRVRGNNATTGIVCVNDIDGGCPYFYSTRSNVLKPPLPQDVKSFVIYNNKPVDPRIIVQSGRNNGLVIDLSDGGGG